MQVLIRPGFVGGFVRWRTVLGCCHGPWVTQQARQFAWTIAERPTPLRFLSRDRDSEFSRDFDAIFASEGIEVSRHRYARRRPTRSPSASY
ncbi:MAG: hypothetical protein LC808_42090, partial [Actinobacteria bacterium]|nr:hypothetical protein [Actinomycetota bacterium]